jgi:L-ascorbate metabolism protein UlaG (beta-lactamase superfamily)
MGWVRGLPKPRKQKAHIIIASKDSEAYYDSKNHEKDAFVISSPGEYEIKGALFSASFSGVGIDSTLIYRIDIENIALGFCIGLSKIDFDVLIKTLEGVDVLFVPVGGKGVLDANKAMEVVTALEPRLVIPMQYKSKNNPTNQDTASGFIKEFGGKPPASTSKLRLTRKELPTTDRQMFLLE